jgi:Flp pilus assembly pilin Flp
MQGATCFSQETPVTKFLTHFVKDEAATTAIQYCLISAGIGLVVFGAVRLVGPTLEHIFSNLPNMASETIQRNH